MRTLAATVLACLLLPAAALAQTPACEQLDEPEQKAMAALFGRLKGYGCCEDTLASCLKSKPECKLAARLANSLCRQALLGAGEKELEESLVARRRSMDPKAEAKAIALDEGNVAGDPKAPVTAVLYVCSRCPFCAGATLALHREVTEDRLKGKVRLFVRPFPLKSHEGSTEGGLAFLAAARQGKFWPFATFLYKHFDEFHVDLMRDWAKSAGLDPEQFTQAMSDPKLREALADSKKEGVRNGVKATPTLFVNGREYTYSMETGELVDALLEEHERVTAAK